MTGLNTRLKQLSESGRLIHISTVGAGQMGRGLINQLTCIKGMRPSILVDRTPAKAADVFASAGIDRSLIALANSSEEAQRFIQEGKYVISDNIEVAVKTGIIQAVVDATGSPDAGAIIATTAIENKKHIIMLNVETDVVIGPILMKKAREAGVVYTGSAGDEPGTVKELYDFADAIGLNIKVIGKGKNNAVDIYCNPDTVKEEALERGIAPRMLSAFKDGTKTMVEMTAMSNSTGFVPDVRGGHGPVVTPQNAAEILCLKSEGGILESYNTIEYVDGLAPGVFLIVSSDKPDILHQLTYLKLGKGPNYLLLRPFHLGSIETPISIALAVLDGIATIAPTHGMVSQTITFAKKDLKAGQMLDGIGGYTIYGKIERTEICKKENALPISLVNEKTKLMVDVKKDELITWDMVEMDENSPVLKLYKEQEKILDF